MKYRVHAQVNAARASRPARGAWVEIALLVVLVFITTSRPARGAWVEMYISITIAKTPIVAPRKGRVG